MMSIGWLENTNEKNEVYYIINIVIPILTIGFYNGL